MKTGIDRINSAGIRAEMERDSYRYADFIGSYDHPQHKGENDWRVTLWFAADQFVFETNGDPIWNNDSAFPAICEEYGIRLEGVR
jgi:hypothetical protein